MKGTAPCNRRQTSQYQFVEEISDRASKGHSDTANTGGEQARCALSACKNSRLQQSAGHLAARRILKDRRPQQRKTYQPSQTKRKQERERGHHHTPCQADILKKPGANTLRPKYSVASMPYCPWNALDGTEAEHQPTPSERSRKPTCKQHIAFGLVSVPQQTSFRTPFVVAVLEHVSSISGSTKSSFSSVHFQGRRTTIAELSSADFTPKTSRYDGPFENGINMQGRG